MEKEPIDGLQRVGNGWDGFLEIGGVVLCSDLSELNGRVHLQNRDGSVGATKRWERPS